MNSLSDFSIFVLSFLLAGASWAHNAATPPPAVQTERMIVFPDTANFQTLVLDPHTHSSFSDGHVWPRIRVEEALRDGLDAIAITEHLEWQPHLADIPHPDRNRAYAIAQASAPADRLLVIAGSEITRSDSTGHINALFISDANMLMLGSPPQHPVDAIAYYRAMHAFPPQDAVDAGVAQGAFLFWNHPWYTDDSPDGFPVATKFHKRNAAIGKLQGIEIANGYFYSEQAFQIALDLDLTLMGSSDIHELIDWDFHPNEGGHRPVTLVLAEERTAASLRQALVDGRTLVWFKNTLLAREPEMREMLHAALSIVSASYGDQDQLLSLTIRNQSDVDFQLQNNSDYSFSRNTNLLLLKQHTDTQFTLKTPHRLTTLELPMTVLNALVAPKQSATVTLSTSDIAVSD